MSATPPTSGPSSSVPSHAATVPSWRAALAATFLLQTAVSFLGRALPVVGPELTDAAGVPEAWIGHLAAAVSAGSLWFLMGGGGLITRYGPVRVMQAGAVLGAFALVLAGSAQWALLVLASVLIGIGYGPAPPAGSEILARHAPPGHRALVFSVKQAGVPLGGALVGLMLPPLLAAWGLAPALLGGACVVVAIAVSVQPLRAGIDADRSRDHVVRAADFVDPARLVDPIRALRAAPALPWLSVAGASLAVAQGVLFSFFVTYCLSGAGMSLTTAGFAFAVLQAVGIVSRVVMGWVADRLGSASRTLILLAVASAFGLAVLPTIRADWPMWQLMAVSVFAGVAVASWNGVMMAEIAQQVPRRIIGPVTSGTTFFTFIGYVLGPAGFALLIEHTGDWRLAFHAAAVVPLFAVVALVVAGRLTPRTADGADPA